MGFGGDNALGPAYKNFCAAFPKSGYFLLYKGGNKK
jgi:hypothetical protein